MVFRYRERVSLVSCASRSGRNSYKSRQVIYVVFRPNDFESGLLATTPWTMDAFRFKSKSYLSQLDLQGVWFKGIPAGQFQVLPIGQGI